MGVEWNEKIKITRKTALVIIIIIITQSSSPRESSIKAGTIKKVKKVEILV
jgi:hypothetical protein